MVHFYGNFHFILLNLKFSEISNLLPLNILDFTNYSNFRRRLNSFRLFHFITFFEYYSLIVCRMYGINDGAFCRFIRLVCGDFFSYYNRMCMRSQETRSASPQHTSNDTHKTHWVFRLIFHFHTNLSQNQ